MQDIHPSLLKRKILHVDMDAFYAAVEIRDNPSLADKAVIVGGSPQSRGVVCTANYIARKYGVKSAMPCAHAYRLCPDAIFVPPDFARYKAASAQVFDIFHLYSDKVEGLSLDEAFIDVTNSACRRPATIIAEEIRQRIFTETKLTASVGVAPNKMLAKIASDINKPNGLAVIKPTEVSAFIRNLPVRKISGVGPVTAEQLLKIGINTCFDALKHEARLRLHMPHNYEWLLERCRGVDDREVAADSIRKSIGSEETFSHDLSSEAELRVGLRGMVDDLVSRMEKSHATANRYTLKIKYADFITKTYAHTLPVHTRSAAMLGQTFEHIFMNAWDKRKSIRLIGVSATNLSFHPEDEAFYEHPVLFDER